MSHYCPPCRTKRWFSGITHGSPSTSALDLDMGLIWPTGHEQVWSKQRVDKHLCTDTCSLGAQLWRKQARAVLLEGQRGGKSGYRAQTGHKICRWGHQKRASSQPNCCMTAAAYETPRKAIRCAAWEWHWRHKESAIYLSQWINSV